MCRYKTGEKLCEFGYVFSLLVEGGDYKEFGYRIIQMYSKTTSTLVFLYSQCLRDELF